MEQHYWTSENPTVTVPPCCFCKWLPMFYFHQSSTECVSSDGGGGRAPSGRPTFKGQSDGLSRTTDSCCSDISSSGRPNWLGERAHTHHKPCRAQCTCWKLKSTGKVPRSVPEPGPYPRPRHGILHALVLLLYLRLRVREQRASDGAHEGAWGRHHQHHSEQGAAANWGSNRPLISRVRPLHSQCSDARKTYFVMFLYLMVIVFISRHILSHSTCHFSNPLILRSNNWVRNDFDFMGWS